jgi:integrase
MARKRRGRGEGSVYQRKDGIWIASLSLGYDGDGKRQRLVVAGLTKKEALQKLDEKKGKHAAGLLTDAGTLTVGQFFEQWLEAAKASVCKGTHATYNQHVRDLLKPKLGGVRLAKLNTLHVEALYRTLAEDGHGTARQRHAGVTLRVALSWAVRHRLIPDNPVKRVKMPAHAKREIKPLTPEQIAAFLRAAQADRLYALYPLALDSGMRQGEMLGLIWSDVDFERGAVAVSRSLEEVGGDLALKEPKTAKSRRTLVLSEFTREALREHRKRMLAEGSYRPDGPVFCGVRNKTWLRKSDVYRHSFAPILKRAGLTFRFHDLRHCCASLLLAAGTDVKTVQERLGHSTPVMTLNTYSHVLEGAQALAAAKLNGVLAGAVKAGQGQMG